MAPALGSLYHDVVAHMGIVPCGTTVLHLGMVVAPSAAATLAAPGSKLAGNSGDSETGASVFECNKY